MSDDFSEQDKVKCLLWCNRHCCLCGKACGANIEIAHIEKGSADIDNAIPLCFECHSEIGRYNKEHPLGNKYRPKELKARRDQIYEEQTRHLVPPIHYKITQVLPNNQRRRLPDVGFKIWHMGDSLPVNVLVNAQILLGNKDLGWPETEEYYSGKKKWNLNPRFLIRGHFSVPKEAVVSSERLEIKVKVTIIDQYERHHQLLPVGWIYTRDKKVEDWYLEP
ncbi:MAG TPA: hypothetical protein VMW81_09300 [Nitrospinota bacterium]|nr:hypothetical protein [Nitrospinota bacterium]